MIFITKRVCDLITPLKKLFENHGSFSGENNFFTVIKEKTLTIEKTCLIIRLTPTKPL